MMVRTLRIPCRFLGCFLVLAGCASFQPGEIEFENRSAEPAALFPYSLDPDYFPPLEVAWLSHRTWAKKTNRRIDTFYYEQAFPQFIPAGGTASGFIFVNLDKGTKYVPVEVLLGSHIESLEFFLRIPGFRADYSAVDAEALWAEAIKKELQTEDEVREWAALVGSRYRNAPFSSLYFFGRGQDFGLQIARSNIHQRNHMRLWLAPATFRGRPIWVGQISRDIGSKLTTKSSTFTTHKIEPDVDDARDTLALEMISAQVLEAVGYAAGVGARSPEAPGLNLTDDPFITDGLRVIMFLSEEPVSYENMLYFEWEEPGRDF